MSEGECVAAAQAYLHGEGIWGQVYLRDAERGPDARNL